MLCLTAVATGCGALPTAPPPSTAPPAVITSAGTGTRSPQPAEATLLRVPARPCQALNARIRAKIGMPKTQKGRRSVVDVSCQWTNDPGRRPPFRFRDLKVSYSVGFEGVTDLDDAKRSFDQKRRADYRRPSGFGGAPQRKGMIKQVGSAKAGRDFDEGYYVYYVWQIAEARRGEGFVVIRKHNVLITIRASGSDVPGRQVRQSRPLPEAAARDIIDAVAGPLTAAVR
ncbi:hypothetical protein ACQEUU_08420 [Nonomuraea sp. CA-218870]|uniref:hypothetical protein n=1 Tax=Nonomuraea sp. CA-218870 TaxID=3239998 RepID=UPI003D941D6D